MSYVLQQKRHTYINYDINRLANVCLHKSAELVITSEKYFMLLQKDSFWAYVVTLGAAELQSWVPKRLPKHRKWCHTYSQQKRHTYRNYDILRLAKVCLHKSGSLWLENHKLVSVKKEEEKSELLDLGLW